MSPGSTNGSSLPRFSIRSIGSKSARSANKSRHSPWRRVTDYISRILETTFWAYPAVSIGLNIILGWILSAIYIDPNNFRHLQPDRCSACAMFFTGSVGGARSAVSTVSSAAISIATFTFSMTVLSMQLAAFNYTPRILDEFLRDRVTKLTVAVYLGTFAYTYVVLMNIQDATETTPTFVPILAVNVTTVHLLVLLGTFMYFIQYFVTGMRLETVLHKASRSAKRAAERLVRFAEEAADDVSSVASEENGEVEEYETENEDSKEVDEVEPEASAECRLPEVPPSALRLLADDSGYVSEWTLTRIVPELVKIGCVMRYACHTGEFVTENTLLAWVWSSDGGRLELGPLGEKPIERLGRLANCGITLSVTRQGHLDISLGVRQLSDIAVRALSPGTNDPQTAIQVLDSLSVVFARLAQSVLPHTFELHPETGGIVAMAPGRTFNYLLSMATDPIRAYGVTDINVVRRALYFLGDIGSICRRVRGNDGTRVKSVELQLEQWVRSAEEKFGKGSVEMTSLRGVEDHVRHLMKSATRKRVGNSNKDANNEKEKLDEEKTDKE